MEKATSLGMPTTINPVSNPGLHSKIPHSQKCLPLVSPNQWLVLGQS